MHKIILILLIFIFLQGCGKKNNPEYKGVEIEQDYVVNLKI